MSPRILFVAAPEADRLRRCLALAAELAPPAARCIMLASPDVTEAVDAVGSDMVLAPAVSDHPAALAAAAREITFDAVVFDHPGIEGELRQEIADSRPWLDLEEIDQPADALLRADVVQAREAALARRGGPVQRVLVALGLDDRMGLTSKVVERVRQRYGHLALDVVLGARAPSLKGLSRIAAHDPRLSLHLDVSDTARITGWADLGVVSGEAAWEACALGLPSVLLGPRTDAQVETLAAAGAALAVDPADNDLAQALDRALVRLVTDPALREIQSAAAAALSDGLGAPRAAAALLTKLTPRDSLPYPDAD